MATEDKYVITVETANARITLDNLIKKIESVYKGIATLKSASTNAATGLKTFRVEVRESTVAVNKMAAAQERLAASYKTAYVSSSFSKGRAVSKKAEAETLSTRNQRQQDLATVRSMFGGVPEIPSSVISAYNGGRVADIGSDISSKWPHSLRPTGGEGGDLTGGAGSRNFNANESDDLATGRTSKQRRGAGAVRGPRSMALASNISHKTYTTAVKRQKQEQKQISLFTKFGNGMKNLTKQTFMLQMGMLGVSFSSQALMSSLQGLGMQAITGLADTEGMIKNLVLSDALGGTHLMEGLDFDKLIEDSLKAKGALAGLSSVLVLIANKVFEDPEAANKIANAITLVVNKLTSEEFIKSILGLVDAITNEGFITSLTSAAKAVSDLVNKLGENGLLDKVLLLVVACQFLMPVLAMMQLLLLALGSFYFAALIAVLIIVGSVIWAISSSMEDFGKSGNILLDVFNVIYSAFVKLWELLLYIPRSVFDVISSMITELSGGLIKLENPFATFTNTLWKLKDLANTTFGGGNSDYQYDTGSHQYVQINNFNKSVGSKDAEEVLAVMRDKKSRGLDWS